MSKNTVTTVPEPVDEYEVIAQVVVLLRGVAESLAAIVPTLEAIGRPE